MGSYLFRYLQLYYYLKFQLKIMSLLKQAFEFSKDTALHQSGGENDQTHCNLNSFQSLVRFLNTALSRVDYSYLILKFKKS